MADTPPSKRREPSRPRQLSYVDAPYPVVGACRRDSGTSVPPVPPPPDSWAPMTRQPSEITIAAGVPLPLSARRIFSKVAGTAALALLMGVLIFAFAHQPKSLSAAPLSSNVTMVPKTVVTEASANPTRTVRGKVTDADAATDRAGDTAAVAAVAVTTAGRSQPSAMRTAHLTSTSKATTRSSMKHAKYVPESRAHAKHSMVKAKHARSAGHRKGGAHGSARMKAKLARSGGTRA